MQNYFVRCVEEAIKAQINTHSAIFLEGIGSCGKATTAQFFSKGSYWLNKKDSIDLAKIDPSVVLNGKQPRLIAEWQNAPEVGSELTERLAENQATGQFILTASSAPEDKKNVVQQNSKQISHILMRPMSLAESKESRELVSLKNLFDDGEQKLLNKNKAHSILDTAFLLCRGGWPSAITESQETALGVTKNCYDNLFSHEFCNGGKFRNKKTSVLQHIVKSYSMQISTDAPITLIRDKITSVMGKRLDDKTMVSYIEALQDLYIIEDLPAWNPKLRSNAIVRLTPARYFTDSSIATSALGIKPDDLLQDLRFFEMLFKNFAMRDLRVYSSVSGIKLSHYRDNLGLECDVVAHLDDTHWAAINIRLGGEARIEEAAQDLKRLKRKVACNAPTFMMVLTATGMCYKRADGVYIVPINCLTY